MCLRNPGRTCACLTFSLNLEFVHGTSVCPVQKGFVYPSISPSKLRAEFEVGEVERVHQGHGIGAKSREAGEHLATDEATLRLGEEIVLEKQL